MEKPTKQNNFNNYNEELHIEFKREWYWKNKDDINGKNEFIKDFTALFNTQAEKKFLCIGIDEKEKTMYNWNNDVKELINIDNLDNFKQELNKLITNCTQIYPESKRNNDLKIDDYYNLDILDNILHITIEQAPFLLSLNIDIRGFARKSILYRAYTDKQLGIVCMGINDIEETLKKIQNITKIPSIKDISIVSIVEAFQKERLPKATIEKDKMNIYILNDSETNTMIRFIYIPNDNSKYKNYITEMSKSKLMENKNIRTYCLTDKTSKDGYSTKLEKVKEHINDILKLNQNYTLQTIDDYIIAQCQDKLSNKIFHNHKYNIKNFITHNVKDEDFNAIKVFEKWLKDTKNREPILFVYGTGGIGKTTAVRQFIENIHSGDHSSSYNNILFITSSDIINKLQEQNSIKSMYDFYKILIEDSEPQDNLLEEHMFNIAVNNGNILVVIDGMDEIVARLKGNFNINDFVKFIIEDCYKNFAKTKIIMTCREEIQLDRDIEHVKIVKLNEFDEKQIHEYFGKTFNTKDLNNKLVKKACKIAKQWKNEENNYIPYVLDLIASIVSNDDDDNDENDNEFSSKILQPNNKNEYVIGKICDRETRKNSFIDIDCQIQLFFYIANKYNGKFDINKHIDDIMKNNNINEKNQIVTHPLLKIDNTSCFFRYDFFNELFKVIYASYFIQNENNYNNEYFQNIIKTAKNDNTTFRDIIKKINHKINIEDVKINYMITLHEQIGEDKIDGIFLSNLLMIILKLSDTNDKTKILIDIFSNKQGELENINIIDSQLKCNFNFTDIKLVNCYFESYPNFVDNTFKNTELRKCILGTKLYTDKNINKTSLKYDMFKECIFNGDLENKIIENHRKKNEINDKIEEMTREIFKKFWKSYNFTDVSEHTFSKDKHSLQGKIIMILVENQIIILESNNKYKINPDYYSLRKIFEENHTCDTFKNILKIVKAEIKQ